jgi:phenylalanyl-tRNA synthetase alpha chain
MTPTVVLDAMSIRRALDTRDLTDPAQGPHAMQVLVTRLEQRLGERWNVPTLRHRANPVVPVEDNYDRLLYRADAVARDVRYTRYLSPNVVLRTHTSAMIPPLLERIAQDPPTDVVLSCPGIVYRRDAIDRVHTGEPHQIDLWRIRTTSPSLDTTNLEEMIATVVEATLPGYKYRTSPAEHPYTLEGKELEILTGSGWLEIGECGLAHPEILATSGLPAEGSGLAMGLGLDRLLLVHKGISDIRLLRATDERIASQMVDLTPYRTVSRMPAVTRDISIAVSAEADPEQLGDEVRNALGAGSSSIEAIDVLSVTPGHELPPVALGRLGMEPAQSNVLLRIVLRDLTRTLTDAEANELRDRIYAALHEGVVHQWAAGPPATESSREKG